MNNAKYIKSTKRDKGFYELNVGDKTYWLQSPAWTEGLGWLLTDINGNGDTLHFDSKKNAIAHLESEVL